MSRAPHAVSVEEGPLSGPMAGVARSSTLQFEGFQTTTGARAWEVCLRLQGSPDVAAALCLSEAQRYVGADLSVGPGYDGIICSVMTPIPLRGLIQQKVMHMVSRLFKHFERQQ